MLIGNLNPFILNEISLINTHKKQNNIRQYKRNTQLSANIHHAINNHNDLLLINNRNTKLTILQYKCCYTKILELLTIQNIIKLNNWIKYVAKLRPLNIIIDNILIDESNHKYILVQSLITGYMENFAYDINLIINNKYIKIPAFYGYYNSKIIITPNYSQSRSNKLYMTIQQNKKFAYF